MSAKTVITFYDVKDFGFYRHGKKDPEFGDMRRVLTDLGTWAGRMSETGLTKTYDGRAGLLPAYFLAAPQQGGTCLLCLWNETPSTEGAVASLSAKAPVGDAEVSMTPLEEGHIPGFPSYYWFLPDEQLVANVRFEHAAARAQMHRYLTRFMGHWSSYAITEVDGNGHFAVHGYCDSGQTEIVKAYPRMKLQVATKAGQQQFLVSHAAAVSKVKKKATLTLTKSPERAVWQQMLHFLHLAEPTVRPREVKVEYETDVDSMTEKEVKDIIAAWSDEEDSNYGFVIKGEGLHWLDHAIARTSISLELAWVDSQRPRPESLLQELERKKANLLKLLK